MMARVGRLLLVRHGQASVTGDDYDVLSPLGWEQGRVLGSALAARGVADPALVRGDMRRHRESLEAMTEAAGWSGDAEVDAGWDEFDHTSVLERVPPPFQGQPTPGEFQAWFEESALLWTRAGEAGEYAESWPSFLDRTRAALERTASAVGRGTAVVVTSGGVIAACASGLIDLGDGADVRAAVWNRLNTVVVNSSVTTLVVGRRGTTLLSFNEHTHLTRDVLSYR